MRDTMASLAYDAARRFGERTALSVLGTGQAVSFAAIDARAAQYAGGLARAGVGRGVCVILHLPNGIEWVVAYHALARLGAVVVPANILLSAPEVGFLAADSGAVMLIAPVERHTALAAALAEAGSRATFILHGNEAEAVQGAIPARQVSDAPAVTPVEVAPEDLFTIGYTSGTTGRPKGATQTHRAVFLSTAMTATVHVRTSIDRVLTALPFAHVYGNVVMNAALLTGLRLEVMARFDAGEALAAIGREKITLFDGVPTMYYQMLAHPGMATADFTSLSRCTVGGQTIPVAKLDEIANRFGCPVLELWGMTEVSGPASTHSPYWPPRHGTIGLPFSGTEMRIVDLEDSAQVAADGIAGELWVRGPLVTQKYWKNPEASRAAIDEAGWLATGDVALREPDGYLRIVDRRKDMIITAGYNIYPAELEQVLALHPAVAMAAVSAIPDAEKGELAKAFIVLRPGAACDEAELIVHCRSHLAAYKVPRLFAFVDDLPTTSTGKVMRRALRGTALAPVHKPKELV